MDLINQIDPIVYKKVDQIDEQVRNHYANSVQTGELMSK
jgi:hypothetical protein